MRKLTLLVLAVSAACGDSIVAVDADDTGRSIRLEIGQKLEVDLRNCSVNYGPPAISSAAVEFTGSEALLPVTPGCNTTRYHLVGRSAGDATVVFRRNATSPDSVVYRVDVH